ncbi:DUF456 family protein [Neisseria sp. Dent CA1/247]|uniref:Membrane protein n=1 Tax=Neisseria zoodegmatis TaxID=326523 RepID=A0A1X3CSY0_9NEIS|nr:MULTISPECIES: DUF456 family protein [Neisseria]MDO5069994.1 DUF456 family protein [Neisseria zoodegmatis]OSI10715.1 hypothetical protein BWD10_04485 [Neisseria zoodegmatis]UOO77874.1 DUF456 family protein [Neisseria sp. Dent CA1/247]SNU79688.1 Membrane protein [Neisseria zoodegmatis]SUA36249.1 Membrane protein [Neisseria zoodegmatis]
MTTILIILGLISLLIGLLGTVYPAIPGLGLMFAGAWLIGYAGDYQVITTNTLIFLAVVTVLGTATDYVAGMLGAKFTGASKQAIWGALIGGLVGAFFSLPGLLLGPLVGAGAGELWARKDLWAAGKVSIGTFIGFIIGVVAKVGCALTILLTLIVMGVVSLV